jgi:DNA-binding response OmpR family regulator
MCVLLIDSQTELATQLASLLWPHGLSVQALTSCEAADRFLRSNDVTLVLLSTALPDRSGVQYLKLLRSYPGTRYVPLIMLGSRATDIDVALSLDAGADDYVHKPPSPIELQRRILAVIRRCEPTVPLRHRGTVERRCGPLVVDESSRRVRVGDQPLSLRPSEIDLLLRLMRAPGRVFTREQLVRHVCESEDVRERVIDVHIRRLRASLAPHGADGLIETVRGVGYRVLDRLPDPPPTGDVLLGSAPIDRAPAAHVTAAVASRTAAEVEAALGSDRTRIGAPVVAD